MSCRCLLGANLRKIIGLRPLFAEKLRLPGGLPALPRRLSGPGDAGARGQGEGGAGRTAHLKTRGPRRLQRHAHARTVGRLRRNGRAITAFSRGVCTVFATRLRRVRAAIAAPHARRHRPIHPRQTHKRLYPYMAEGRHASLKIMGKRRGRYLIFCVSLHESTTKPHPKTTET